MAIKDLFSFLNFNSTSKKETMERPDYLSMITEAKYRPYLANFFEKSVVELIPHKDVMNLINAINSDIARGIFTIERHSRMGDVVNSYNVMTPEQLNSKTHRIFKEIVKNNFGKSAYAILSERQNLNIFNLNEVHVLHQEVIDSFGESFVNRILNNDLTPQSLIIIKDILTDKEKLEDFKYLYDFYSKNTEMSQVDFEKMVRGYESYKPLVHELRTSKTKLSSEQISTLVEIFSDIDNFYQIQTIEDVNRFHEIKNNKYTIQKSKAEISFKEGDRETAVSLLTAAFFENFYNMRFDIEIGDYGVEYFNIMRTDPRAIKQAFDIEGLLEKGNSLGAEFSEGELEVLQDLIAVVDAFERKNYDDSCYDEILSYCQKYESKGNSVSKSIQGILKKLPKVFSENMLSSISTIESLSERAHSGEPGIHEEKNPLTKEGTPISMPVYVLDGADFSLLSTTNFVKGGLSGNKIVGDIAESWFKYENGTSHICCSYANQDHLTNLEFNESFWSSGPDGSVTYLFDTGDIYTMGPGDIFTPETARRSDVNSRLDYTKFMEADKFAGSTYHTFNEVAINRYNYDESVRFGGKVIPSAILCSENVSDFHLKVAESFTRYCIEQGLKPEGWKMPIVVVNKKRYEEIQNQKAKGLITKNSEYFVHEEPKEKVVEVAEQAAEVARQEQQAIEETVEKQVSSGGR